MIYYYVVHMITFRPSHGVVGISEPLDVYWYFSKLEDATNRGQVAVL